MKNSIKKVLKKALLRGAVSVLIMCVALTGFVFMPQTALTTYADSAGKTEVNTKIGTDHLAWPNSSRSWYPDVVYGGGWSYVYYGKYNGSPVKYRVLDKSSSDYGVEGGSMLLDCDNVLKQMIYHPRSYTTTTDEYNRWEYSDVKAWLNGDSFLNNSECFTELERGAIAPSVKAEKSYSDGPGWAACPFQPLTGEKVFVLDNAEAHNANYGYIGFNGGLKNVRSESRAKQDLNGRYIGWWTRTYFDLDENNGISSWFKYATMISGDSADMPEWDIDWYKGCILGAFPYEDNGFGNPIGVSPAINIKRSSILFTTEEEPGVHKLTLKDSELKASVTSGKQITRSGNSVTIPYTVTGDPNRLSLMITDSNYSTIHHYSALETGNIDPSGTATFNLPEGIDNDDRVWILAERTNGSHETDYAGEPVEITIPTPNVTYDTNGGKFDDNSTILTEKTGLIGKTFYTPVPHHDSLAFMGWYTARNGGEQITRDTVFSSPQTVYARWLEMYYVDENGTVKDAQNAIRINDSTTTEQTWGGWYYITGDIEHDHISVRDDTNIIICDDANIDLSYGFSIREGRTLTIYGQEKGNGRINIGITFEGYDGGDTLTSNLIINGGTINMEENGIGFHYLKNIVINGGTVNAVGYSGRAAIGCSENIIINGGTVTAEGRQNAAGIGNGPTDTYTCSNVVINGGTVTATGGNCGAGIGGGKGQPGINVTINGGTVTASGGKYAAGIGAGSFSDSSDRKNNHCGNVVINGGKVTVRSGAGTDFDIGPGKGFPKKGNVTLGMTDPDDYIDVGSILARPTLNTPHHFADAGGADLGAVCGDVEDLLKYNTNIIKAGKSSQGLSIEGGDRSLTYGDEDPVLTGAAERPGNNGVWTWTSSEPDVAAVDPSNGQVSIRSAGETTITATYVSDAIDGEVSIKLTVNKAEDEILPDIICTQDVTASQGTEPVDFNREISSAISAGAGIASAYEIDQDAVTVSGSASVSDVALDNYGILTAKLSGGEHGDTVTIPVRVTAQNYDCSVNVVIKFIDPTIPVLDNFTAEGLGTEDDPWQIDSAETWNSLAAAVNNGANSEGGHFKLTDDITVTEMIGTHESPFRGSFDGDGHTLTFNYSTTQDYCAPFRYVGTGDFTDLITAGTITTSKSYAAGLIGEVLTSCRITDCVSDVDIEVSGNGQNHSGFVANSRHVDIEGCAFTGIINGSQARYCAGFLGWDNDNKSKVLNCLYAGTMQTKERSSTFVRTTNSATNSYYMTPIGQGRDKGKQAVEVKAAGGAVAGLGNTAGVYETSGLTAYSKGLAYRPLSEGGQFYAGCGHFYAGPGEKLNLTLSAPGMTGVGSNDQVYYTADAGTLTYTGDAGTITGENSTWSLTMPTAAEVTGNSIGAVTVTASSQPKQISITGATAEERGYIPDETEVEISSVTFDGAALRYGVDYTVTGEMEDDSVGESKPVLVTVDLKNRNYALAENTLVSTVRIRKTDHETAEAEGMVMYEQVTANASIELPALPEGASYGTPVISGDTDLIDGTPEISGTTLTYSATSQPLGKTAVITIPVTGAANYNDYDIVVTITAVKELPMDIETSGYSGAYDGRAHGISVTVNEPAGAEIMYGTKEGVYDQAESPAVTNVSDSPLTVYYQVSAENYMTVTGSETVVIRKAAAAALKDVTVSKPYDATAICVSAAGRMRADAGVTGYKAGAATVTGSVKVTDFKVDDQGNVTARVANGAKGDMIVLPVTITSANYEDSTLNIKVTLTDRQGSGDDSGVTPAKQTGEGGTSPTAAEKRKAALKKYKAKVAAAKALRVKLAKVKDLKGRKAQVKWKKPTGKIKATGFQIQYSTKKNFKKGTKKLIKKASARKATIKKLKKGKTYYFRIRTYTTVKNTLTGKKTRVYGKWSKAKKVRVRKY